MSTKYVPTRESDGKEGPPHDTMTAASIWVIGQPDKWAWDVKLKASEPEPKKDNLGVLKLAAVDLEVIDHVETPQRIDSFDAEMRAELEHAKHHGQIFDYFLGRLTR